MSRLLCNCEILVIGIVFVVCCIIFVKLYEWMMVYKLRRAGVYEQIEYLVAKEEYKIVLDIMDSTGIYWIRYKMKPKERKRLVQIRIMSLERTGKTEEAAVELASVLTGYLVKCEMELWSQVVLDEWIRLYKKSEPITVDKFYFGDNHEMVIGTEFLLNYAIQSKGCRPPIGYQWEEMNVKGMAYFKMGCRTIYGWKYYALIEQPDGELMKVRIE